MFNRRLKQEVMEKSVRILELERKVTTLLDYQKENGELKIELGNIRRENAEVVKKFNDNVLKLREQNRADLFWTAAEIQKSIMDGESEKTVSALNAQHVSLLNYQSQLNSMGQQYYASDFLRRLGIGGIYGGL